MQTELNFFKLDNVKNFKSLKQLFCVDHIVSCVLYNSPKTYNMSIDFNLLKDMNLDLGIPIFYENNLTKQKLKDLTLAKKYCDFNLILNEEDIKRFNKIKIKYYLININKSPIKLINNIMLLNINKKEKFKLIKCDNNNYFNIKLNKNKLIFNDTIYSHCLCLSHIDEIIDIKILKYNIDGFYYLLFLKNKSNNIQKLNIEYRYKLNNKYYNYNKINNGINIKNILSNENKYFICNYNLKYKYKIDKDKIVETNHLHCFKNITLKPGQKIEIYFFVGQTKITKRNLISSFQKYNNAITDILNCKVKSKDKKLEYMFNRFLPSRLIFDNIKSGVKFFKLNYTEMYNLYKQKKISSLSFYLWLKETYFGFKENGSFIKFCPLCKEDFLLEVFIFDYKKLFVFKNAKSNNKYLEIDKIRFYNCDIITKQKLKTIDSLTLVV